MSKNPFDLILKKTSLFVTILNQCTERAAAIPFAQRTAEEVFAFVLAAVAMLETQIGYTLTLLRRHDGKEYDNALFSTWLSDMGATWEPAKFFWPKYRLGHPEKHLFLLSKNIFTGSKYPKIK